LNAYFVPEWVRVRQEDFGLLFYDTRSTKLTFVRSGDRLLPPSFTGACREMGFADSGPVDTGLSRLLDYLVHKRLLVATPPE